MTDTEILDGVYQRLVVIKQMAKGVEKIDPCLREAVGFVEQEWQKRDDQELVDQYNRNREVKDHISTTHLSHAEKKEAWESLREDKKPKEMLDVTEIERHRGLEIGPDGTVTSLD